MRKQPNITKQTRQNLIDAFWDLYVDKRIEKITVKEITTKAGYNRSTFYEYFTDVYDVLEQIEYDILAKLQELPLRHLPAANEPFPMGAVVTMYEQHGQYLAVLLGDRGDPSFQSKVKNHLKPMIKQKLTDQGATDGFELDYVLEYAVSAMIGILGYWFNQKEKPPIEKLIKWIEEISQSGVMHKLVGTGLVGRK